MAADRDRHVLLIDRGLDEAIDAGQKVLAVQAGVETEDVRLEHAHQRFALPGQTLEGLGIGPGYMPEQCDGGLWQTLAQQLREQGEMIVLHEHHRIASRHSWATAAANVH